MKNPNRKSGLRLSFAKLLCHWLGHRSGKIVTYSHRWVLVGEGCARCEVGEVTRYRTKGPMPLAVKDAVAQAKAHGRGQARSFREGQTLST